MQIPIIKGIYRDNSPDLRASYPVNMFPIVQNSGISEGYLRPADGFVQNGTGPGICRGGINWNGVLYRVMGSKLVSIDNAGNYFVLGDVGGTDSPVRFDYSFDRLAIASNFSLFYLTTGGAFIQVTDPDLISCVDVAYIDGYFMTTDGENLVVTELTDPTSINPLKYGSAESDPDPVKALLRLRNEIYAIGRYTIEVFDNVGGNFFPFQRIDGAQVQKGSVGTHSCCVFSDAIAFLGSGRGESPGIYIGANATAQKISTLEIDKLLTTYTEYQLELVRMETRNNQDTGRLYVHLPDRTLVFDAGASKAFEELVWLVLTTDSSNSFSQYKARDFVWCYGKWLVGDPTSAKIGYATDSISSHWGEVVRWEFSTMIGYNEGRGAIVHDLELCALTGNVALSDNPQIATAYSTDGYTWSQDRWISAGTFGQTAKRLFWLQQGHMRNWRVQRFRSDSRAHISIARLEANIEGLNF